MGITKYQTEAFLMDAHEGHVRYSPETNEVFVWHDYQAPWYFVRIYHAGTFEYLGHLWSDQDHPRYAIDDHVQIATNNFLRNWPGAAQVKAHSAARKLHKIATRAFMFPKSLPSLLECYAEYAYLHGEHRLNEYFILRFADDLQATLRAWEKNIKRHAEATEGLRASVLQHAAADLDDVIDTLDKLAQEREV